MATIETKELKMTVGGVEYPVGVELAKRDGKGRIIADTYLPLSGGTISGNLEVTGNITKNGTKVAYVSDLANQTISANGTTTFNSNAAINITNADSSITVTGDNTNNKLTIKANFPTNYVTTDTAQTITGNKNFKGNLQQNGLDVVTNGNEETTDYAKAEFLPF
mgnify:FL=1